MDMLASCCLVQVSARARTLSMHEQLRDFAYSIVQKEGSSVVQRSRLLNGDAENALRDRVRKITLTMRFEV